MERHVCVACGTQFAETDGPPPACPICEDPRQYVPPGGQRWTTVAGLARDHRSVLREQDDLLGIGVEPSFAIGQRALLVPHGDRSLLWDCVTLLDGAAAAAIDARGGLSAIAISHPHYYGAMVDVAHRFGCPVWVHEDDARWVMRPDPAVRSWSGDVLDLGEGLTLLRLGGHFRGGQVLHRATGAGSLMAGDIVYVIPDLTHVAFLWSYPNMIPLPQAEVERMAARLAPYRYERLYAAWWDHVLPSGADAAVQRSAVRHGAALRGELLEADRAAKAIGP